MVEYRDIPKSVNLLDTLRKSLVNFGMGRARQMDNDSLYDIDAIKRLNAISGRGPKDSQSTTIDCKVKKCFMISKS